VFAAEDVRMRAVRSSKKATIRRWLKSAAGRLARCEEELLGCETIVGMGWHNFVQVSLALGIIRDKRLCLCRIDFQCFEAYCQSKWEYGGAILTA
jgi:hypothetical protein